VWLQWGFCCQRDRMCALRRHHPLSEDERQRLCCKVCNVLNERGRTPLMAAAKSGVEDMVRCLLDNGVSGGYLSATLATIHFIGAPQFRTLRGVGGGNMCCTCAVYGVTQLLGVLVYVTYRETGRIWRHTNNALHAGECVAPRQGWRSQCVALRSSGR
jgi:hypothetical protein